MNKCTPERIEGVIVGEESIKLGKKTTCVVLTLANGFEVVGISGCVDPSQYDHEIGTRIAKARAVDKIWELEGYVLQTDLSRKEVPESQG